MEILRLIHPDWRFAVGFSSQVVRFSVEQQVVIEAKVRNAHRQPWASVTYCAVFIILLVDLFKLRRFRWHRLKCELDNMRKHSVY